VVAAGTGQQLQREGEVRPEKLLREAVKRCLEPSARTSLHVRGFLVSQSTFDDVWPSVIHQLRDWL
jgi:hypothetical protein